VTIYIPADTDMVTKSTLSNMGERKKIIQNSGRRI
jgi:hypothetical protein